MNRRKLWIILSIAIAAVVAIVITLVVVFARPAASAQDYAEAATTAGKVSEQHKAFEASAQGLVSGAGTGIDATTIADLTAKMNAALDGFKQAQTALKDSPAVKQTSTEQAFNAYDKKAQNYTVLAEKYRTSIPLYAAMRDSCSQIGKVTASNLFSEIKTLIDRLEDPSKEGTLKRFDAQAGGCLTAAEKLRDSGDDSFAKLGGVFATLLTDIRAATVTRFDETASLGYDNAALNYAKANSSIETAAADTTRAVAAQQKEEGEAADFSTELEELTKLLKAKS